MTTEDFAIESLVKEDIENILTSADEYVEAVTYHFEEALNMGETEKVVIAKYWNDDGEVVRTYQVSITLEEI